jgi:hypothetical protein
MFLCVVLTHYCAKEKFIPAQHDSAVRKSEQLISTDVKINNNKGVLYQSSSHLKIMTSVHSDAVLTDIIDVSCKE